MVISRTPFRISFFGGGTDYPAWYQKHGGATLSTSIDKYTYITTRYYPPFFPVKYRVVYSKIEGVNNYSEIEHPSVRETIKFLGLEEGIEIHNAADLPARSGLGSSSAFTVGLLNALYRLTDKPITQNELAAHAIHIEQNLIKENVGSQDQVAVAVGGFNKVIFSPGGGIKVQPVNAPKGRLKMLNDRLMLFFTGFQRNASEIAAEWIKNAPKKENELHAMRKMVDEAVAILEDEHRSLDEFGRLLHDGWQIKRSLSASITTSYVDEIYEKARKAGAIGGKLLGAGQGGFMVLYIDPKNQHHVRAALKDLIHVPFLFETAGSQIIQNGLL